MKELEFLRDENSIGARFIWSSVTREFCGGVRLSRLTSRLFVDAVRLKSMKSKDKWPKSGWVIGDRVDESIGSVTVSEGDFGQEAKVICFSGV